MDETPPRSFRFSSFAVWIQVAINTYGNHLDGVDAVAATRLGTAWR